MAVTVKLNLVEGTRAQKTVDGWVVDVEGVVSGLTAKSDAEVLKDAVEATGVPELRATHPVFTGSSLRNIIPTPESGTVVRLRLRYEPDEPIGTGSSGGVDQPATSIEVGTSVGQQETNTTAPFDTPITVSYTDANSKTHTQGGTVPILLPETTMVVTRTESTSPLTKAKLYVGTTNNGGWPGDPSAKAGEWLCMRITGKSDNDGETYQVSYEFAYRPDDRANNRSAHGWEARVYYNDPKTGKPPSDLVVDTGDKIVRIYDVIDFTGLNL